PCPSTSRVAGARRPPFFDKTPSGGQVVELSGLIRRRSLLDDHPPAPPPGARPVRLRRPPPACPRAPRPAPTARRVQETGDPAATRSRWNERGEIMHRPVRFADDIEPLVQFVEETEPSRILEATLGKLRDGLSVKKLLTASALAVTRSSDLPPGHHGGPLHPLV